MHLIGVFYFFRAYNYKSYKSTCNTCNFLSEERRVKSEKSN